MAVNVQPHSGAQANMSVFFGLLNPGDTVMGMSLAEGGHLSHGMKLNMSGKWFNVVSYGLNDKEEIDSTRLRNSPSKTNPRSSSPALPPILYISTSSVSAKLLRKSVPT